MKLSSAELYSLELNNKVYSSLGEYMSALKNAKNLIADVYVDGSDEVEHLLFSSLVRFIVSNEYLFASIDGSFSIDPSAHINCIEIIVHESGKLDSWVMSSRTYVNEFIESGDQNADLFFLVGNLSPYNEKRIIMPDSKFNWLETTKLPSYKLEDLPTSDSIDIDESTYGVGYYPHENSTMTLTSVIPGTDGNYTVTISVSEEPNPDGSYGVTVGLSNGKSFVGSIKPNDNNQVSADSFNSLVYDSDESKSLSSYIACEGYIDVAPFIGSDVSIEMTGGEDSIESDDDQTDHIVSVTFDAHKQASFDDGNGNTLTTFEWNTSRDSQLDFWVVTNEEWPSDETPVIVVDETGELLRRDSESDNPPYYQFHIRKADIENIENRSEIILYIQFASYYTDSNHDDPSGTLSVQVTGSTDLVAQPLWLDDETFSPGFELQVTQNVSHTLMIPLTNMSAEISISDVDGLGLDSDIQYVVPLPDGQQRPDVVKNALVQFTIGVDYVSLNVNVWIAEAP